MKDKNQHIDEVFKKGLQNLELDVTDADWNRVADTLSGKKKRRFGGFWLWFLSGMGVLTLFLVFLLRDNSVKETVQSVHSEGSVITDPMEVGSGDAHAKVPASSSLNDEDAVTVSPEGNEITDALKSQNSGKTTPAQSARNAKAVKQPSVGHSNTGDETIAGGSDKNFVFNDETNTPSSANNISSGTSYESQSEIPDLQNPADTASDKADEPVADVPDNIESKSSSQDSTGSYNNDEEIQHGTNNPVINDTSDTESSLKEKPEPEVDRKLLSLSFGATGGFAQGIQRIGNPSAGDNRYGSFKSFGEQPAGGLTAGVRLKAKLLNDNNAGAWFASTGMDYTQLNFDGNEIRFQLYDSIPFLNPDGDTIAWIKKNYRDTTVKRKSNVRYTFVQVPVSIGRSFYITNRLSVDWSACIQMNILTGATGETIDPNLNLRELDQLGTRAMHLGYGTNLGVNYALGRKVTWGILGSYNRATKDVFSNSASGEAAIDYWALKTSLLYEF